MDRVAIVGATGAGKTTLGRALAGRLGCPALDLDELFWGPQWTPVPRDTFRAQVAAAVAGPRWVTAGNYSVARDLVWRRAEVLVWLDYPLPLVLWRLANRTVRRILTRETLWGGNRETWRAQFLSRDSLFIWAWTSHPRHRLEYPQLLTQPEYAHLTCARLRSPRAAATWLAGVTNKNTAAGDRGGVN